MLDMFGEIEFKLLLFFIIVFSAVLHEYMHAWMANFLGDPTARYAGRLTINPFPHLDLWYTVILPLALLFFFGGFIGMAKPVPYNPRNLRNQKYGSMLVGGAGPATNILVALFFGGALRVIHTISFEGVAASLLNVSAIFYLIVYINMFLALFNLLPFHPLDGSKFFSHFIPRSFQHMMALNPFMGIFLAILVGTSILRPVSQFLSSLIVGG